MPGYKGHVIGALIPLLIAAVVGFFAFDSSILSLLALVSCLAGAIFPDIDVHSKARHLFMLGALCLLAVTVYCEYYALSGCIVVVMMIPLCVRHRGLFHNFLFLTLLVGSCVAIAIHFFPHASYEITWSGLWFFIGIVSHLFLDRGGNFWRK